MIAKNDDPQKRGNEAMLAKGSSGRCWLRPNSPGRQHIYNAEFLEKAANTK